MKFSLLTIHPRILEGFCSDGLLLKAREKNALHLNIVNIRDYSDPPHHRVDDSPYGGGPGMVMKPEPIARAIEAVKKSGETTRVIILAAKGKKFTQSVAKRWLKYEHLVLICGRYEGIDERIAEHYADEEVRVGDYVLMGGEVAAAVVVETVGRLVPGVLGNPESLQNESFSSHLEIEHEQYTRPPLFEGHSVPEVLLKGNHSLIKKWRSERSKVKAPSTKNRKSL